MNRATTLLLLFVSLSPISASANSDDKPPDNELRAAYCLGYFVAADKMLNDICTQSGHASAGTSNNEDPGPVGAMCKEHKERGAPEAQRIRTYLLSKERLEPDATIALPEAQGEADFRQCTNVTESNSACITACLPKSGTEHSPDNFSRCVQEKCTPPMCQKMVKCSSMDYLPW